MSTGDGIAAHYTSGSIWTRLEAALAEDGVEAGQWSIETLAPYDQFHGRGLEVTKELADGLTVAASDHILDVGSGLGGPARYLAQRFGCRVTGIDLTDEFCAVARRLNAALGMESQVTIEQGSALAMPFAAASFDGAYSMNVSMNIEDKAAFFGEIHRVLRPGAWLVLSEIAKGPNDGLAYPTPWAESAASSFLVTPQATRALLQANGFIVDDLRDTLAAGADYAARSRERVERGEKPLHRAVSLVHGETAEQAAANTAAGTREGQIIPIEIRCTRSV